MENKHIIYRIIADLLIFIFIIQGWWIPALIIGIFCLWKFQFYIEIIIAGLTFDILYGFISELGVQGYIGLIVSILFFILFIIIKKVVRK